MNTSESPSVPTSPFHTGELAVQTLAGSREAIADIGARVIRSAMPDQHRQFFAQLPFLVVGALDARGQPWATLLSGTPGFAQAPEPTLLRVNALPPATAISRPNTKRPAGTGASTSRFSASAKAFGASISHQISSPAR